MEKKSSFPTILDPKQFHKKSYPQFSLRQTKKLLKLPKDYLYPVCGFYLVLFLYAYEIQSSNQITCVIGVSLNFIIDKNISNLLIIAIRFRGTTLLKTMLKNK